MEVIIKNRTELNSAAKQLYAHCIQMCNDTTTDDICRNFIAAKDYLVAIYKYKIEAQNSMEQKK